MYLSSDLAADIQIRAAIPSSQTTFSPTNLYALCDSELRSKLLPLILKNLEDYYVAHVDYNLTAGQSNYLIPTRAVAAGLRDVEIVQTGNNLTRTPLERLNREDLYVGRNMQKSGFYIDGNQIVVYPTPIISNNLLRLTFYCRPNQLVDSSACGQITGSAQGSGTYTITVASLPSTFTTAAPLDVVSAKPHFDWWAQDQTPITVNTITNTLTFSGTVPTNLSVGDWLCLSGQSCVVQVPVELQPLLSQYVTVRVLSALGDTQALQAASTELTVLQENALELITPRVAGKLQRAVNSRSIGRYV